MKHVKTYEGLNKDLEPFQMYNQNGYIIAFLSYSSNIVWEYNVMLFGHSGNNFVSPFPPYIRDNRFTNPTPIEPLNMSLLEYLEENPQYIAPLYKNLENTTHDEFIDDEFIEVRKDVYEYLPDYLRDSNEIGLL